MHPILATGEMRLVTFMPEWRRLDGKFLRILELPIAFDAVDLAAGEASAAPTSATTLHSGDMIAVTGLDLMTPRGARLATGVSFKLEEGGSLLVTGPNASGKTLMGCMLLGLLPIAGAEANVSLPGCIKGCRPPLEALMTAPQRVYLPLGTLGDQVCYPSNYLVSEGGLAADQESEMLRALGAAAAEDGLYRSLSADFGVTPLTLTQRMFMPDLYKKELRLGLSTPAGWQLASTAALTV